MNLFLTWGWKHTWTFLWSFFSLASGASLHLGKPERKVKIPHLNLCVIHKICKAQKKNCVYGSV